MIANKDNFIKNLLKENEEKKEQEKRQMQLTEEDAKYLMEILSDSDSLAGKVLAEKIQAEFDRKIKEIRTIRSKKYCNHILHEPDKEEMIKFGSPKQWGIENEDREYIENFYKYNYGYCEKCGLPFKYMVSFSDKDFDEIEEKYNKNFRINIRLSSSQHEETLDQYHKAKEKEQTSC